VGFKRERLGPRLVNAARSGARARDVHVFLGGTGAVGGTALLQMLSMYEEMFAIQAPGPDDVPILAATGTTRDEMAAFTKRLFRFVESRHGGARLPTRVRNGYLTSSGVFVALERFEVSALPMLRQVAQRPPQERGEAVAAFLAEMRLPTDADAPAVLDRLREEISGTRPFRRYLAAYLESLRPRGVERFRSVVVGIPIPSLIAYHQDELAIVAEHVPGLAPADVETLKRAFIEALRDDLVEVQRDLAETVLIAHTTGVGGMFDEDAAEGGRPSTRLGFAHAALDRRLGEKARFAGELTELYSRAGLKVLITAAAIGIDEVRVRERIPLHREVRQMLHEAAAEVFPGSKDTQGGDARATRAANRPVPSRQVLRTFRPLTVPFDTPPEGPVTFDRGEDLIPSYAIRSGENGFFSVADAEALYRVMRVASADELGLMLATVGLLGEDRLRPWFPDGVCYFTETDDSRQVFDFLRQPALFQTQLSGLEPMSLQDLGSAKHQAELHAVALLILLHRLRTLDVDAIDPYVDLDHFDARGFFVHRSRALTFEDLAAWDFEALARDLQVLAGAEEPGDLLPLTPPREYELFPTRRRALDRVLDEVVRAVWTIPSLGLPILFERGGVDMLRTGYYVAPIDLLVTDGDSVAQFFRDAAHDRSAGGASFDDVRDYHLAVGGFVDVRPHAIVCSARNADDELAGKVSRATSEDALRKHLESLEPYSFFSTCGLLALWFRLRGLYGQLREAMIELGSLHEYRWEMPRDEMGHVLVVPGVVEARRMISEGLEKTTGTERLDGIWGYERRPVPDRRGTIPGLR
jgi:hypothetical protein